MKADGVIVDGCHGLHALEEADQVKATLCTPENGYSGKFVDDITKQPLKDELVREARVKELSYFNSKGVWLKRPKEEARKKTGRPPISVRWVDVNKSDETNPSYRSRLVARQLKARDNSGENFFAPTPPLEALRTVLMMAASTIGRHQPDWRPDSPTRMQVSCIDVARAYFNAKTDPESPCYVALPDEDPDASTSWPVAQAHVRYEEGGGRLAGGVLHDIGTASRVQARSFMPQSLPS